MSYYDQYNSRNAQSSYPPQQYGEHQDAPFNPYDNTQPHQTYEQAGYGYQDGGYGGYRDEPAGGRVPTPPKMEKSVFDNEAYASTARVGEPRSSQAMKRWRYEHQGNLWTRGGGLRVFARFFFCLVFFFLFFFISVILSLLLWIQPPNITIGQITPQTNNGSVVQVQQNPLGITINLGVPVAVNNPNYFSVKFSSIYAEIFYPINNTKIGGGTLNNLDIQDHKQTNFTLPFALDYNEGIDPSFKILEDLASHCGFLPGTAASPINIQYQIHLDFKVLFVPIKPTISNSANFACPITEDEIADLLKAAGLGSLAGLVTDIL